MGLGTYFESDFEQARAGDAWLLLLDSCGTTRAGSTH